jgi:alanine-glyoxylate transaminase/serine-glyoxylate transaminase/serine-pyruvate transaminase
MAYWGGDKARAYHHTAPVNSLYALHESLRRLHLEGLEASFERHRVAHLRLLDGITALGLELLVEEPYRLPQLNAIKIPSTANDARLRAALLNDFNIEIGAGLGPLAGKIWRVGLMGEGARADNVDRLLNALAEIMSLHAKEKFSIAS